MKNMTSKTWIRRAAAAAVLAAAAALIALATAAAGHAAPTGDTSSGSTSPSYAPTPVQTTYPYWTGPWYDSSFHHRHAAEVQSSF
jgi:hypothetical protein